jgi:hypothetical protein
MPPELHRRLAFEAAEARVSMNRLVSLRLAMTPIELVGRTVGDLNSSSNYGHESDQTAAKTTKRLATALGNADRSVD